MVSALARPPTPEPGNRFRLRLRLRCVRACERAKLRARDDSPVAGAGRANLWVVVVVRPSGQPSRKKVRAVRPLTDDSCSFGGGECFAVVVSSSRWCFVRVLGCFSGCWPCAHRCQPSRWPLPLNLLISCKLVFWVYIGGWGCGAGFSPTPNREIDFDCAYVCVACVRASERSCVREAILQWLGVGARICGSSSSVVVHRRPGSHVEKKFAQWAL